MAQPTGLEPDAYPIIAFMLHLSRTVRFCLDEGDDPAPPRHNGHAGWPPMRGLGRYYELHVHCVGQADPQTGYFINIRQIDQAFARHALPLLQAAVRRSPSHAALGTLMQQLFDALQPALLHAVAQLRLQLTPFYSLTIEKDRMSALTIRQQFDFSAAHRLHVPTLSEEENRTIFGKCNNPAGHGHNYQLEVAVEAPIGDDGQVIRVEQLDALVDEAVIQHLDHKHLNLDVPEFAQLNPTVENIAKVIFGMLRDRVTELGVSLREVSVWETPKTVCTYRGEAVEAADQPA